MSPSRALGEVNGVTRPCMWATHTHDTTPLVLHFQYTDDCSSLFGGLFSISETANTNFIRLVHTK